MKNFLKFLQQVLVNTVSILVAFTILLVLGIIILIFSFPSNDVEVKESSVLFIKLNKPFVEKENAESFAGALDNPFTSSQEGMGVLELKKTLKQAKEDENIKGIFLNMGLASGGLASFEEIRNALIDFKESKKFIVVYGEYFTEKAYYLASVADKIYLNPAGVVEFNGFSAERMFYIGALEKLEIKPEIFRVGNYKSAVEPFMLEEMSEASREQTKSYLGSIYNHFIQNIAKSRKIDKKALREIADSLKVRNPEDAKKYKLITDIGYYDEARAFIQKKLKIEEEDKVNFISLDKYQEYQAQEEEEISFSDDEPKIAVIVANGEIITGQGNENFIGSEKIAQTLRKIRRDENIKAVVLRINSPGGSALASDVMWREIMLTKEKIPVIASMSDVAASGGYYMAMACDTIVAQPNTITGSIGIFGILFDAHALLENKLGITTDRVSTGAFSDLGNPNRAMRDDEKIIVQEMIEEGYEIFTSKAAKGRNMKIADLKKIASGRVWSGIEAKERGLVDVLGGFDEAIAIAAKKADLKEDEYELKFYPKYEDFFDRFLKQLQVSIQASLFPELLELPIYLQQKLQFLNQRKDWIQARMPYDLMIL